MTKYKPTQRLLAPANWANRNILTQLPFGIVKGMFKVHLSGKTDCVFAGPELFVAWWDWLLRYLA